MGYLPSDEELKENRAANKKAMQLASKRQIFCFTCQDTGIERNALTGVEYFCGCAAGDALIKRLKVEGCTERS